MKITGWFSANFTRRLGWFLVVAVGLLQVWAHRNDMSPDGISYLELGHSAMTFGLPGLSNAYWSPLYPLLVTLVLRLAHPAMEWEFTAVHGLNFFIYLVSFASFRVFLRELEFAQLRTLSPVDGIAAAQWRWIEILGTVLFLWAAQFWLSPSFVNPDLCVATSVYLATAILLRISRSAASGGPTWFLLGVILGVAYLAKAAMFPLGLVFLACAFFLAWRRQGSRRASAGSALAMAIFLLVAAPWIRAISEAKGRWTFGDSGRIAYAEYVNGATLSTHWQGMPAGTGVPLHPTREISADPPMYEFAQPIPGSYPPWRDPSYWYDGIRPHFAIRGQLWVLFRALNMYFKMFSKSGALYVVFLALAWAIKRGGGWQRVSPEMWLVMLPALAALGMYALVLVELRYVSPFALMLLVWTISRVEFGSTGDGKFLHCISFVALAAPLVAISWPVIRDARDAIRNRPYEDWQVASALPELGIRPGAGLGYIGSGGDAYWAYLAGDRIIAEIPGRDQKPFLSADSDEKLAILRRFADLGVQAVITKNGEVAKSMPGWRRIGETQFFCWSQAPR